MPTPKELTCRITSVYVLLSTDLPHQDSDATPKLAITTSIVVNTGQAESRTRMLGIRIR
jgi:hypothetical protein